MPEAKYITGIFDRSMHDLIDGIVPGEFAQHSYGWHADLAAHDAMLVSEFVGQREILLFHALVTVRIRRGIDLPENFERFRVVWEDATEVLLEKLDSRWLVSACDTIVDHWPDPKEKALAIAGALFMNTVKLYETERRLGGGQGSASSPVERTELFDGLVAFWIGRGDMPFNMQRRLHNMRQGIAGSIVWELFRRANCGDSVYRRFALLHQEEATRWG